jgi:hypothetical protein
LQTDYQKFKAIQPLLQASIDQGWAALASEEQQMVKIAAQLAHLQDVVNSLASSITGAEISSGQSIITTTVKTLYNIATEVGGSFSFLSMAASVFTVGKMYYDIISANAEIGTTLKQIAALQLEASEEAQAAAGTKIVLQLVYNLELSFASIVDVVPQITTMWSTEQQKVQAVISALQAGADPSTYFELYSMPTANANWQAINSFAMAIPTLKSTVGTPVTLNPQAPSL